MQNLKVIFQAAFYLGSSSQSAWDFLSISFSASTTGSMERDMEQDGKKAINHADIADNNDDDPSMQSSWNFKAIKLVKQQPLQSEKDDSKGSLTNKAQIPDTSLPPVALPNERASSDSYFIPALHGDYSRTSGVELDKGASGQRGDKVSEEDFSVEILNFVDDLQPYSIRPQTLDRVHSDSTLTTNVPTFCASLLGKSNSESNLLTDEVEVQFYNFLSSKFETDIPNQTQSPSRPLPLVSAESCFPVPSHDARMSMSAIQTKRDPVKGGFSLLSIANSNFSAESSNVSFSGNEDSVDFKGSTVGTTTVTEESEFIHASKLRRGRVILFVLFCMFLVVVCLTLALAVRLTKVRRHSASTLAIAPSPPSPQPTRVKETTGSMPSLGSPVAPFADVQPDQKQPSPRPSLVIRSPSPPIIQSPITQRSRVPSGALPHVPVVPSQSPQRPTMPSRNRAPITSTLPPYPEHGVKLTQHPVIPPSFL